MAGEVSKKELESILMQAMFAAKNVRAQRGRLLQFQLQLEQAGSDDAAGLEELITGLVKMFREGLEAGARYLTSCLEIAAENGARLALNPTFAAMPDEQLYDALLAQRFPARPTTQTEAFSRIEAAFYAVKLPQEHHLWRCIKLLVKVACPDKTATAEPTQDGSGIGRPDDTVAVATENLAKIGLSDPAPAATTETPQTGSNNLPRPHLHPRGPRRQAH